ncbi:hypothetical protein Pmar_PMAR023185, partial [Perkinsus marinus ATCC 50983]
MINTVGKRADCAGGPRCAGQHRRPGRRPMNVQLHPSLSQAPIRAEDARVIVCASGRAVEHRASHPEVAGSSTPP